MQVFRSLKTNASRPSQGYLDGEVKKLQWDSEVESCWSEVIQTFCCSLLKSRFFQVTLDALKQSGISITIVRWFNELEFLEQNNVPFKQLFCYFHLFDLS